MSSANAKITEGLEHIRQAEKHLKTGFFSKWKPDYDSAAYEYQQAATSFKNAKSLDKTKDSYMKAAECYINNKVLFQGAKCFEQAALVCRDQQDLVGTATLMERAAQLFMEQGTPDTAALTLDRGAKILEVKYPEKAVEMYMKAFDFSAGEEKFRQAAEYVGKAARLLTKLKQYDKAVECVTKEIEMNTAVENFGHVFRLVVAKVLLLLSFEDQVAAQIAYQDTLHCPGFDGSDESATLGTLLQALENGESELVTQCLNQPHIKFMDNEYAKLARDLKITELSTKKPQSHWNEAVGNGGEEDEEPDGYGDDLK